MFTKCQKWLKTKQKQKQKKVLVQQRAWEILYF